jgi:hypothetical protein
MADTFLLDVAFELLLVRRPRNNLQYRPDLKSCQTDMLFSEKRYADDLPMSDTVTRYLG